MLDKLLFLDYLIFFFFQIPFSLVQFPLWESLKVSFTMLI